MPAYNHQKIEKKWREKWSQEKLFAARDVSKRQKKYVLVEFPFPSGAGLHMGHLRPYVAGDVYARYMRAKGFETLYPMGWDAFGLPAENYAIKHGVHPSVSTTQNIKNAKKQIQSWGIGLDWAREVNTSDSEYYKWTQWIFLQLYKAGLAYEATGLINWCPKDKTGLANEEAVGGVCERCGTAVEKKELRQWYLKITAYAEKLLAGLKDLDWPEQIKIQQANWIGKSEGAEIKFSISIHQSADQLSIKVFTTRPDTIFGATYIVVAPEHELVQELKSKIQNWDEVDTYIAEAKNKTDIQRSALEKDPSTGSGLGKTGVELKGIKAINPANKEEISVWIADYVLGGYGTGAIMAVPAHDERDFEFAKKYNLPIKMVVCPHYPAPTCPVLDTAYIGEGHMVDSGQFNGMRSEEAKTKITDFVGGKKKITYKLRDWVFSRQRYWGEPIPLVHCEKCALRDPSGQGIVPVPEKDLPVKLPKLKKYQPTGTGESPLAAVKEWVNVKCPTCKGPAKRETNTMPQWAGSSWYYLRYTDPKNKKAFAGSARLKRWLPVDVYFGGMEHTTLHLLYSRFWHLFLYDKGFVPTKEPYAKRVPHGIILGPDGEKMSKSRGNVVNPDDVVKQFGADTLRMYEMFLGPHEQTISWKIEGIVGIKRFLDRVWRIAQSRGKTSSVGKKTLDVEERNAQRNIHKTIKKVTEDIENFRFNTAVSALMILLNEFEKSKPLPLDPLRLFLKLLAPFAPHMTEEVWCGVLGNKKSIALEKWPEYDPKLIAEDTFELIVQINGKVRDKFEVPASISQEQAEQLTLAREHVKNTLGSSQPKKVIFVPNRLINLVL